MNSLHVDEDRLLEYADGELTPKQAQQVRTHLEGCWECRAEYDELQKAIGECVRYRKAVRELITPPAPWKDLTYAFLAEDARQSESWRERWFGGWNWARLAPVASALALVAVLVYRNQQLPVVSAAQILEKAATGEQARPKARRIQIRAQGRRLTDPKELKSLEAMFTTARYDFGNPLSARAYLAWNRQLADKRDELSTSSDAYDIRTTTASSELVEATLKLRTADFSPVETTMRFRNEERVEITELPGEPAISRTAPVGPAAPGEPAVRVPEVVRATSADELRVFAALRRLNADLGDPIEISNTGDAIVVTTYGLDPARAQQLANEFDQMARVRMQASNAVAAPSGVTAISGASVTRGPMVSPFEAQLVQYFGGKPAVDRFADQSLDLMDTVMARAHALRRLGEHFPASVEAGLSAEDQATLRELRAAHQRVLAEQARNLAQLVDPVLVGLGAGAVDGSAATTPEGVFQAARNVEQLLAGLLTGSGAEVGGETPTRLRRALVELGGR